MTVFRVFLSVMTFVFLSVQSSIADECSAAAKKEWFLNLKHNEFKDYDVDDDALALQLADCLGSPDTEIRDKLAYEGLFVLLRGGRVSDQGKISLLNKCESQLVGPEGEGFIRPFAGLCIAEVARTDRIDSWFTDEQRTRVVKIGVDYLKSVSDYRGFDEIEGWRHGVAHASDILMQLSLNENVGKEDHIKMLNAISTQISPTEHFYIYGEPERLAWPVTFIAIRGTISDDEWAAWFTQIVKPEPELDNWADAFSSQAGLIKRHNLSAFLSTLYLRISMSDNENLKSLMPYITSAIQKLP